MDFRQTPQSNNGRPAVSAAMPDVPDHPQPKNLSRTTRVRNWLQTFTGIMLMGVAVLIAGVALALTRGGGISSGNEHKYVDPSKYQAVFLVSGQVYFGSITNLNNNYIRLTNVYYLTQDSASSNSNYSLVKLGCQQIHDPYDEMLINRSQVTFWENLQDDGKVVKSIKQFNTENPDGPDCTKVSNQTQATTSTTQGDVTKK